MSTRGIYGIRKNGVDKCTYNHCDSYPEGLGAGIIEFVKDNYEKLDDFFEKLVLVEGNEFPSFEDFQYCKKTKMIPTHIKFSEVGCWYSEIRGMQGNFKKYDNLLDRDIDRIYMTNAKDFIKDSLFCEYGYIINLDTGSLEFWKGFQETPDETNRYGKKENRGYYPCKLSLEIPLEEIVNNSYTEKIVERMNWAGESKVLELKEKLCSEWNLSNEEIQEIGDAYPNGVDIRGLYENADELAESFARNLGWMTDENKPYFDVNKFFEDLESNGSVFKFSSGRTILIEEE